MEAPKRPTWTPPQRIIHDTRKSIECYMKPTDVSINFGQQSIMTLNGHIKNTSQRVRVMVIVETF
jgi:hypothetical protein